MSERYEQVKADLRASPRKWLVTGVAGFIGSHLLETLLKLDQHVVGLDSFATGHKQNLDEVQAIVRAERWGRFRFIQGDIRQLADCRKAVEGVDHVLHQAALGSVPRSLADPVTTNEVNITGTLNMLIAARDEGVESFVYASSSAVYGDHPDLPKVEDRVGTPLSPYAITKRVNELYAETFAWHYGFSSIGLRYFNVFGPRQDPEGPYAAVIPKWLNAMLHDGEIVIYGDGETSRDFCYVDNAVQANLLAALATKDAESQVYNVAFGARTSLNELFETLRAALAERGIGPEISPRYADFRPGDVRHSQADISQATAKLGYKPTHSFVDGVGCLVQATVDSSEKLLLDGT